MQETINIFKGKLSLRAAARFAILFLFAFSLDGVVGTAFAGDAGPGQNNYAGRKVLTRVEPEYPSDLRVVGIGGYVHLNVTVNPSGAVVSSQIIGGNPILAQAAVKAVSKWKFSPAATSTSAEIWFHFSQ